MARSVANLFVAIGANISNFEKGLVQAEKRMKKFGKNMEKIGTAATKLVTVPILALGGAAFTAAMEVDKAMDAIREGTGATGEQLRALGKDFEAVFRNVPQDAETVGSALADLNTRTGLSGMALQDLTLQMVNLSRVAKTDVNQLIASTTRVFGDWSIATEKQSETLDHLWKVSQNTGITVDDLSKKVVQFGAPLRQMGFDFKTSTALLGKFEKEGVNAELVMGSLRIALGKMAKQGVSDPARALQIMIKRIKEAGSTGKANALALEMFGARAGPDMAAAIREGRFEVKELIKVIGLSGETINGAAKDTLSFNESIEVLRNKATLVLTPLGQILIDAFDRATPYIEKGIGLLQRMSDSFSKLSPETQKFTIIGLGLLAVLGPLFVIMGMVVSAITVIGLKVAIAVTALGALTLAGVHLTDQWKKVKETGGGVWDFIADRIKSSVNISIWQINKLIDLINFIPGINIPKIDKLAMSYDNKKPMSTWEADDYSAPSVNVARGPQPTSPQNNAMAQRGQIEHTGTIRVEGVNDKGELVAAEDIIIKQLRREVRR